MSGALAAAGWRACKIRPEAMTPSRAVGPRLSATGGRDACWSASTIPRFRGDQAPQLSASSLAGMSAVAGRQHCAESCHSRDRNRAARFDPIGVIERASLPGLLGRVCEIGHIPRDLADLSPCSPASIDLPWPLQRGSELVNRARPWVTADTRFCAPVLGFVPDIAIGCDNANQGVCPHRVR